MSNAFSMSMVTSSVRRGGCFWLNPVAVRCVNSVKSVVVEWFWRKPCWESSSGICGVILRRRSFSKTLEIVERREMGLYEEGLFGDFFGLRMGMMSACFHMFGKVLRCQAVLYMSVRWEIAIGPRCFRWKFEMRSGPSAFEFLMFLMISATSACVKGDATLSGFSFFSRLMIFLLLGWVGL